MNSSIKTYTIGFISSVVLTLAAFTLVNTHVQSGHISLSHEFLTVAVILLAVVQLIVQLIFFLHVGKGEGSRWNLIVLFSTIGVILILVTGSLWIMNHLNYNMTPGQMDRKMLKMEGMKE